MPILVRPAILEDAEAIAWVDIDSHLEAYRHIFGDGYMDGAAPAAFVQRWQAVLLGTAPPGRIPEHLYVAVLDGVVVGYAGFGRSRDDDGDGTGEVYAIYVHPSRWRSGVGRFLMAAVLRKLKQLGYHEVTLWALDENDIGRAFYEREGWCTDGATLTPAHGHLEVRYRRRLHGAP